MDFTAHVYWAFLPLVWVAWRALPLAWGYRLLLAASYLFYAWWSVDFLVFMAFSTAVDFYVARALPEATGGRRRGLLVASLVTNFGLLASLKYTPLALLTLSDLGLVDGARELASVWVIPVGISFYTFQSVSYTIDVYRGRLTPCPSLERFALFVSFFPQLVAGPIVRASTFFAQLEGDPRARIDAAAVRRGAFEIGLGLFFKMHVADHVGPDVDRLFDPARAATPMEARVGALLFGGQIFADFAGYSWIAIGSARLLGFAFPDNFRAPYSATSLSDFWRRWHISLSTWLRDYLYIPLGGSRHGALRTYAALLATMLLGGLWHGASWSFLLWGAIHGVALAMERPLLRRGSDRGEARRGLVVVIGWVWTMTVVFAAWVFFRAESMTQGVDLLSAAARPVLGDAAPLALLVPLWPVLVLHAVERRGLPGRPWMAAALGAMLAWMAFFSRSAAPRFIYFQF